MYATFIDRYNKIIIYRSLSWFTPFLQAKQCATNWTLDKYINDYFFWNRVWYYKSNSYNNGIEMFLITQITQRLWKILYLLPILIITQLLLFKCVKYTWTSTNIWSTICELASLLFFKCQMGTSYLEWSVAFTFTNSTNKSFTTDVGYVLVADVAWYQTTLT